MYINKVTKRIFLPMTVALSTIVASAQNTKSQQQYNNLDSLEYSPQALNVKTDLYSYFDKDGKRRELDLKIGHKCDSIKTDNKYIDSILRMLNYGSEIFTDRDYIMFDKFMEIADSYYPKTSGNKFLEDKELKRLENRMRKGRLSTDEIIKAQTPEIFEIDNWSEGLDRRISYIKIAKSEDNPLSFIRHELDTIGKKVGFKVAEVDMKYYWFEDYSIRRADGKIYHPANPATIFGEKYEEDPAITYLRMTADYDKVNGKSYLEGGNVLNTINSKGEPAAIIGENSIFESLLAMNMGRNKTNIARAKRQIADDLGLKPENITYIPQIDYHIDMFYRPLQKGVVAVPDLNAGIEILKEIDTPDIEENEKEAIIKILEEVRDSASVKLKKAEEILNKTGYKTIKIPCFSYTSDYGPSTINYMNGIAGTSPEGKKFYITNRSEIDALDEKIAEYFKKAGADEVFFVSTLPYLMLYGGIDCLTQEM